MQAWYTRVLRKYLSRQGAGGSQWPPEAPSVALGSLTLLPLHAQVVNLSLQLSMSKAKLQGTTSVLG